MKIVTFGEIMIRLATPDRLRFSQAQLRELTYCGSETNVAVSLFNVGLDAASVTKLPRNPFVDYAKITTTAREFIAKIAEARAK